MRGDASDRARNDAEDDDNARRFDRGGDGGDFRFPNSGALVGRARDVAALCAAAEADLAAHHGAFLRLRGLLTVTS